MNEAYAEAAVKKKDNSLSKTIRVLLIAGIVVGVLIMFLGGLFSILGVAIVAVLFFMFPKLKIEYEYVYVDGQIDFDRISGKRKTLLRIDMEQVEMIAPEGSHALDGFTHVQCETKDFSSGDKAVKPYIIIVNVKEKKYRIAFEPSEKMLTLMRQKSPRKVAQA